MKAPGCMTNAGPSRETRTAAETYQRHAAIDQIMGEEETPAWACTF